VFNGGWLSGVTLGNFKAGLSYGWGTISITHDIGAGDSDAFGPGFGPQFAAFEHRRESDLSDIYMSLQCSLEGGGREILALRIETNVGRSTNWKQTTSAGTGTFIGGRLHPAGRQALAVLYLPDDTEGEIILDNTNRRWDCEAVGAVPLAASLDFLLGYKIVRNRSALDPFSARVPPYGALGPSAWNQLPGLTNWENLWAREFTSSTTGFTMAQYFSYHGPLIGVRLRDLNLASPPQGRWHLDLLCAPFLFGRYEFEWNGGVHAPGASITGRQTTHASGLKRFYLEIRAEGMIDVSEACYLEVSGRYSYLEMNGSEPQVQTAGINAPGPTPSINQTAEQTITMTQHFWNIGGNLVLPF